MNKIRIASFAVATSVAALVAGSAAATTMMIDGFETAQDVGSGPIVGFIPDFSEVADASAIGGYRDAQVTAVNVDGNPLGFLDGRFKVDADDAFAAFSADASIEATLTLTWDGADNDAAVDVDGLGGFDATAMGVNDRFAFEVLSADLAGNSFDLTIWDMSGASAKVSSGDTMVVNRMADAPQTLEFSFADFVGVDLGDIGAIQLFFQGTPELDISFDTVRADTIAPIPLPAGLPLLAAGLGGLALLRRRARG